MLLPIDNRPFLPCKFVSKIDITRTVIHHTSELASFRTFHFRVTVIASADVGSTYEFVDFSATESWSLPWPVMKFSTVARLGSSYGSLMRLNFFDGGDFFDPLSIHNCLVLEPLLDDPLPVSAPVTFVTTTESFVSTGGISGKQALIMPRSGSRAVQTRTFAAVYGKSTKDILSFATMRKTVIIQMLLRRDQ